jgi:hypothetical protein
MTTLIGIFLAISLLFVVITNYWVNRLLDGKVTGTYNGFIGTYILKTFRKTGLFHRGYGLPVTLTKVKLSKIHKGTVIFLNTPSIIEQNRCKIDNLNFDTFIVNDLWWTKEISRNKNANDFGRFNKELDEPLTVPFWYFSIKKG